MLPARARASGFPAFENGHEACDNRCRVKDEHSEECNEKPCSKALQVAWNRLC
jgi:hypothetical protein